LTNYAGGLNFEIIWIGLQISMRQAETEDGLSGFQRPENTSFLRFCSFVWKVEYYDLTDGSQMDLVPLGIYGKNFSSLN